jgi:hypothetical protein
MHVKPDFLWESGFFVVVRLEGFVENRIKNFMYGINRKFYG